MPLSVVTADRRLVRASSWSWLGFMDVGSDTSRYLGALDMVQFKIDVSHQPDMCKTLNDEGMVPDRELWGSREQLDETDYLYSGSCSTVY